MKKEEPGVARKPATPVEKPSSERFSKTVMPNATRTLPPQDPFAMAALRRPAGGQAAGRRRSCVRGLRLLHARFAFGASAPLAARQATYHRPSR